MTSLLNQIGAVTALNVRSIPQRASMSIASVVAVALAITVLLFFLALSNGLSKTVEGSGADDVAVVMREGSNAEINSVVTRDQLNILATGPGVAQKGGAAIVSGELLVIVDGEKRTTGTKANMPFRGIGQQGLALRRAAQITEGRMFTPGTNEIVVGAGLLREFAGFEFGKTIRLRGTTWQVVGVFTAPGTVFDSELWADIAVTQSLFDRPNVYQTMRVQLNSPEAMTAFKDWVEGETRLKQLQALSEREYFAQQASQSSGQFTIIAWGLGITMAIGALAGALNTMYSSVAARSTEIATLRIIGFSGLAAFMGTLIEALTLSALGGLLGIALAFAFFNGRTTSTLSSGFTQLVFQFQLSPPIVISAVVMALAIGFFGGILPGIRAARQRPQLELAAQ
ncbi:MAG: ABC transporter permease [Parvularculaceae bacterium]